MKYPTWEEVELASQEQLARWYRYLPSPGRRAIGEENFMEELEKDVVILERIIERFDGFTPELSKRIDNER